MDNKKAQENNGDFHGSVESSVSYKANLSIFSLAAQSLTSLFSKVSSSLSSVLSQDQSEDLHIPSYAELHSRIIPMWAASLSSLPITPTMKFKDLSGFPPPPSLPSTPTPPPSTSPSTPQPPTPSDSPEPVQNISLEFEGQPSVFNSL